MEKVAVLVKEVQLRKFLLLATLLVHNIMIAIQYICLSTVGVYVFNTHMSAFWKKVTEGSIIKCILWL